MRATRSAPVVVAAVLLLAGCGGSASGDGGAPERQLTVFAAASLRGVFTELGQRFEAEHPGVEVSFSFAGSGDLASQVSEGAPADVLATADTATMQRLARDGLAPEQPALFATNTLTIVTAPGNPEGVTSFADLADPGLAVVVCAEQVPCGAAARAVEEVTGTALSPRSEEASVTDVLAKVVAGEADAGLVYATDAAAAADRVAAVPFPEAGQVVNDYPIAVLPDAGSASLAQEFTDLVTGEAGRAVLAAAGFGLPPAAP